MRCTRLLAVLHSLAIFEFPLVPAQTDCWKNRAAITFKIRLEQRCIHYKGNIKPAHIRYQTARSSK